MLSDIDIQKLYKCKNVRSWLWLCWGMEPRMFSLVLKGPAHNLNERDCVGGAEPRQKLIMLSWELACKSERWCEGMNVILVCLWCAQQTECGELRMFDYFVMDYKSHWFQRRVETTYSGDASVISSILGKPPFCSEYKVRYLLPSYFAEITFQHVCMYYL